MKELTVEEIKDKMVRRLARRLSAAYISVHMGLSLEHTHRAHTSDEHVGPYWISLARMVIAQQTELLNQRQSDLMDLMKEKKASIQ